MKNLILVLMMFVSTKAFAVTVTRTGSGATTWLSTTSCSCWSACYNAKNRAVSQINRAAAIQCVQGYTITSKPTCTWPQRDPSRLVATKYW